jgi:hypothetical protein
METRLGILSVLYVNDGTYGAPSWVEIDLISDLAVNPTWNEGESTVRRSRIQTFEETTMALDLPGKLRVDRTDAGFLKMEEAFLNGTQLDFLTLNGASNQERSAGFRFDGKIFSFSEDQAMGAVLFKDFTVKPSASVNIPKIAVVTGGVPVFRDFGTFTGS